MKKTRLQSLNRLPPLKRPKNVPMAMWREDLLIRSRREAENRTDGTIVDRRYTRITRNRDAGLDLTQLLAAYEARAEAMFYTYEASPDGEARHAIWTAYGRARRCRSKYGDIACDLLYRIAEYRRLAQEQPHDAHALQLIMIGRFAAIVEVLEHEENASLGAERRKISRKGGIARKEKFSRYIHACQAETMVNEKVDCGHLSPKRSREIVASKIKPPWRKSDDSPTLHPETLRRHGIGHKRKR